MQGYAGGAQNQAYAGTSQAQGAYGQNQNYGLGSQAQGGYGKLILVL